MDGEFIFPDESKKITHVLLASGMEDMDQRSVVRRQESEGKGWRLDFQF